MSAQGQRTARHPGTRSTAAESFPGGDTYNQPGVSTQRAILGPEAQQQNHSPKGIHMSAQGQRTARHPGTGSTAAESFPEGDTYVSPGSAHSAPPWDRKHSIRIIPRRGYIGQPRVSAQRATLGPEGQHRNHSPKGIHMSAQGQRAARHPGTGRTAPESFPEGDTYVSPGSARSAPPWERNARSHHRSFPERDT